MGRLSCVSVLEGGLAVAWCQFSEVQKSMFMSSGPHGQGLALANPQPGLSGSHLQILLVVLFWDSIEDWEVLLQKCTLWKYWRNRKKGSASPPLIFFLNDFLFTLIVVYLYSIPALILIALLIEHQAEMECRQHSCKSNVNLISGF